MHRQIRSLLTTIAAAIVIGCAGWLAATVPALAAGQFTDNPAVGPVVIDFAESTEALTLRLNSDGSLLELVENGAVIFSRPLDAISKLTVNGNALDNTLTVDISNGTPIPAGGLFYNGLDQETAIGDSLAVVGAKTAPSVFYQPTGLTDGVLYIGNHVITFTGLEPIIDIVPSSNLTVNGTLNPDTVSYTAGPGGSFFTGPSGLVQMVGFESIEFTNKAQLVLNGLDGDDWIKLDNATVPAGLTSITVNGGDENDTVDLISVGSVSLTAHGDAGIDEVRVFGTGIGAVNLGNATFNFESLAFQISGTTPGTDYDQILSSGAVDISGATLTLGGTLTPEINQSFTLIETNGGVTGTFAGLAEGATITDFFETGVIAEITYLGGDGNDVVLTVTGCSTTVTNTNDDGVGSLRYAINCANGMTGTDTIDFNIDGVGPHRIQPQSALPSITDAVIVDGTTEPNFAGSPVIELNGSAAGADVDGLAITAGGNTVRGLAINQFTGHGIVLSQNGGNTIQGNYIGTDVTGTIDRGNGKSGVVVNGAAGNTIGGSTTSVRNLISGNGGNGILLENGTASS